MDNSLILPSIIIASSYIILGMIFWYCIKHCSSSAEQRFHTLKAIVNTATSSFEMHYPDEHPQMKKKKIERLTYTIIEEMDHNKNKAFTIDALIDASMLANDTNPYLRAIRLSDRDTEELRLQHTPVLSMRQKAMLRSVTRNLR